MVYKILRLTEVITITGRSRSSIYADIQKGHFPKPIHIGERARGWLESEIEQWIKARIDCSRLEASS